MTFELSAIGLKVLLHLLPRILKQLCATLYLIFLVIIYCLGMENEIILELVHNENVKLKQIYDVS